MERPGSRACGSDRSVAVFGGVGMVYPIWVSEKQYPDYAVVCRQEPSEFSGCIGRIAAGTVAQKNYYNVRQSYRTCTNYRVLYQCRSIGSIINYEKCESSLTYSSVIAVANLCGFFRRNFPDVGDIGITP